MSSLQDQLNIIERTFGIAVVYHDIESGTVLRSTPESDGVRSLAAIAADIRRTWTRPYYGAVPYLDAMASLNSIDGWFFEDHAADIVTYFLANASGFRGDDAKRLKAELKALLKAARS